MTQAAEVGDPRWTSSCVMADFNGDGLPDIYSVNYLEAEDIYDRICRTTRTATLVCVCRSSSSGSQDQLFLNLGNGRFENVTATSGIQKPNGKGLGVVAADFTGDRKLDLFIANDTVMNFLFLNQTPDPAGSPMSSSEEGLIRGVATNGSGKSEGCMGIAVNDVDGNGLLDLFVTNFHQETNTCYLQTSPGLFEDQTQQDRVGEQQPASVGIRYSVSGCRPGWSGGPACHQWAH